MKTLSFDEKTFRIDGKPVYLNSGEKVLSSRFYPCDSAVTLSFDGLCGSLFQLDGLEVKSHG